jgi:hypothetical protein
MINPTLIHQIEERHPVLPRTSNMFSIEMVDFVQGTELENSITAIYDKIDALEVGIMELKAELLENRTKKIEVEERITNLNIKREMHRASKNDLTQLELLLNSKNADENSISMKIEYKKAAIVQFSIEADSLKKKHFADLSKIKIEKFENQISTALFAYSNLIKEFEGIAETAKFFDDANVKPTFPTGFDSHISFDSLELFGFLNHQFGKLLEYSDKYKNLTISLAE